MTVENLVGPLTSHRISVTMSLHQAPGIDDRLGQALCLVLDSGQLTGSTGGVVALRAIRGKLLPQQFSDLWLAAAAMGLMADGFLEVVSRVDLDSGVVEWSLQSAGLLALPHLEAVVNAAFTAAAEADFFGQWFHLGEVLRRESILL